MRRTTHEHVHFFGTGLFEAVHALLASGTTHDRIIHDDDTFILHQIGDEVELHAHIKIANELTRLQKTTAHIVIADKRHLKGEAAFQRVTQRGAVAAVGNGHDDVGFYGIFTCQLAPHIHAHFINIAPIEIAVRPRKVDVLENTERSLLLFGEGLDAAQPVVIDNDNLARLHVTHELCLNQIQRAGFTTENVRATCELADAQRAEAVRIAHADHFVFGEDNERVSTLEFADGADEYILAVAGGSGKPVQNDFAVDRGLKNGAALFKFLAQDSGVGEVAVVRDGNLTARTIHRERLRVANVGTAGGGIARVSNGGVPHQIVQHIAFKNLRHKAHTFVLAKLRAIIRNDAGAFLAAMLQRVQPVVR